MFPQIAKKKKKDFVVEEIITKQWEEALRDLQIKSKMALKRIPNSILQDFGKVCRIKSIPEFYANYFICSTYKLEEEQLSQVYAQQIQRILTNSSHFHKINQALRQREELIEGLKNSLIIVEGFLLMNQNKSIPLQIKTSIDSFVNDCATLQEIKDLERKKTEELAKDIIRIRTNTTQLLQLVSQWRQDLLKLSKNQKKIKMIYPHQAINCLLMPLYDLLFLKNSILKSEITFGKDQHDPFLQKIGRAKKGTQIQHYFLDYLKADTTDYSQFVNSIIQQLPSQESDRLREKQLQIQRKREQKVKQQKLKQQKLRLLKQQKQKQIKIRHSTSLKTFKPIQKQQNNRNVNSKTSKGYRSQRKIINIDKLIKEKSAKKNKINQNGQFIRESRINDNDSKVLGAYKKMKKKQFQQSVILDKTQLLQQKKNWEKQMKEEKQEKQRIRKLLRQTEKKAIQQTRLFEEKLKRYQQQVQNLKQRVDHSKKIRVPSSIEKPKTPQSPERVKKIIISAYRSNIKPKESGLQVLQQKLIEESKTKQQLEKQIKQLAKQKIKLQKLMQRENIKAVKEVQVNKRKIEKYQQVINKLKNQTQSSHKIIYQLESSKNLQEKKNAQTLRNSIIRQKEIQLKNNIQQKIEEKKRKKSVYQSIKIERPKIIHSKKNSLQSLTQKNQLSLNNKSKLQNNDPKFQILKEKLEQQSRSKRTLQSQIKQLAQQKIKLQKIIERQNVKASKQGQKNSKRIQKYEETINRLKQQTEDSRRIINQIESSKIYQQKKNLEKSRVESVKKKQDQLRRKIQQKIQQRQKRKVQKSKAQQLNKSREKKPSFEKNYKSQINNNYPSQDIEIIKTKQTIQIVFEPKRRKSHQSKELLQAQSKLLRLQKERDLLERKLELSRAQKRQKVVQINNKKISEREEISEKFKDQIEKQKQKNYRLQQNIKKMRKNINSEYQLKLNKQKMKYERERQQLLKVIEKQRQEKKSKDKILQQQMSFLKEMQKKQNQLFQLLQHQKKEKIKKQIILTREIEEKQELINMIELQQIKKGIERQVRKEIQQNQFEEDDEDLVHQQRKMKLQQQIQQLRMQKQNEIEQMNDQNQKLRGLIAQIKAQQTNLLQAIKQNIQMESDTQRQITDNQENNRVNIQEPQQKIQGNNFQKIQQQNQQLSQELQSKTAIQFRNQQKKKNQYTKIQNSQLYKDKQKIQNLVQFYLKSPHKYPGQKKEAKIEQFDKRQIIKNSAQKAKQIQKFQTQLFSLRDLPQYVPSLKNDSLTNHLLNLRDAYDDYQADALRRELFPPLQQQVYQEKQFSYQSQYPMNTLMDHVKDHMRNHPKKQQKNKKNFLAINRVRLAVLQENRKEKQRVLIEEQSRRRIQKQLFDKRRKQREQNFQRQKQKQLQQKEKKREEIYKKQKKRVEKQQKSLQKSKQQKLKKKKKKDEKSIDKQMQDRGKSKESKRQKQNTRKSDSQIQAKQKSKEKSKDKKIIQQNQSSSQNEGLKSQTQKEQQNQKLEVEDPMQPIKQEQSLQQKQAQIAEQVKQYEQQLKNRQRQLLKQQIKLVQQQVRTFINEQQHFQIYQQFINQNELLNRIQQLLDLSSLQIRNLNGNLTIKDDIPLYSTLALLVAKNSKGIEIGLGVFHKELESGEYVCDYLIAHNMENFLNLAFNFSRYLFNKDIYAKKIQFIFNIKSVTDATTLKHFLQFQKKCRRLGQVYLKARSQSERKYVLRRSLFEAVQQNSNINQIGGINFKLNLAFCGYLLKEINQGFHNKLNVNYSSYNVMMAYYLSKKPQKLLKFRQRVENQLFYRELLVTSLLFQKKELQIKNLSLTQYKKKDLSPIQYAENRLDLSEVSKLQQIKLALQQKLPQFTKRCTLQVGYQQINYLLLLPEQAVTSIQSSNSSQTGYFLSIVPKYKLMIIQAQEFLTMSSKNRDLTAFFYIKHFIKNIVDVKKQKYQRIYVPQIHMQNEFYIPQISKKVKQTILLAENIEIGWKTKFPNSVIYTPRHNDLVIQRPFIVALLSGNIERAVEGSPIFVEVVM